MPVTVSKFKLKPITAVVLNNKKKICGMYLICKLFKSEFMRKVSHEFINSQKTIWLNQQNFRWCNQRIYLL